MKKRFCLNEDKLPQSLFVAFSSKILEDIKSINSHNQDNIKGLYQWRDYIEGIQNYLSNPSIAFDYANRYSNFPNGAKFIRDFDYNVGYTVKTNNTTNQAYVYIFMVNLKPDEFGLRIPKNENKQYNTSKNMKQKRTIRLKESDLRRIISESINEMLNESSSYDDLERANQILSDITRSGFIPFASPNPSSTEEEIKTAIIEAMRLIDKAMYLSAQLGYHQPRINYA